MPLPSPLLAVAASGKALPCQVFRDPVNLAVVLVCFPAAPPVLKWSEATVNRAHPSAAMQMGTRVYWIEPDRLIQNVEIAGSCKLVRLFHAQAPLYGLTLLIVQFARWSSVFGVEDGRLGKGAGRESLRLQVGGEMLPAAQTQGAVARAQENETLFC